MDQKGITVMHSAANNPLINIEIFNILKDAGSDARKIDIYGCNVLGIYLLVSN